MKIKKAQSVAAVPVDVDGARDVTIRVLIGEADGAPNFFMRQFTLAPGGCTPRHTHDWEHEVYVVAGTGAAVSEEGDKDISAGDCVFVPPGELHQFRSTGDGELKLLCLVPATSK